MHFCINKMLQMHLMRTFCFANAFLHQQNVTNAFDAKMHFGNATRTFSKGKCSASHFPKENVQHALCKNAFDAYILFCKNAFLHQQNVTNAFDAVENVQKCIFASKMHFCITFSKVLQKCIFASTKCYKCILLCKKQRCVHFVGATFYFVKCSASHFPKENVQQRCAKMHFAYILFCVALPKCILAKCIFASNAFLHQQNVTNAFDAKILFC